MKQGKQKPPDKLRIGKIAEFYDVTTYIINKWCKEGRLEFTLGKGNQKLFENPSAVQSSSKDFIPLEVPDEPFEEIEDTDEAEEVKEVQTEKKELGERSKRRDENKNSNEYVVKWCLNKSLWITGQHKETFIKEINLRVLQASKAHHRLGILVNLYLLEKLNESENPLETRLYPELLKKDTFMCQLITGKSKSGVLIPEVQEILNKYDKVLTETPIQRRQGDSNSLITVASTYVTSFKTYLKENFVKNQNKFLKEWCLEKGYDVEFISKLRSKINGWKQKEFQSNQEMDAMVSYHRKLLGLSKASKVSDTWIKKNFNKVIIYYHYLSKYIQSRKGKKLLTAPLPAIKTNFLYIDKRVFYGVLSSIINNFDKESFDACPMKHYYDYFNIDRPITLNQVNNGFRFTGTIETDGVAVCFHYRRPLLPHQVLEKEEKERIAERNKENKTRKEEGRELLPVLKFKPEEIKYDPKVRTIGVDPGRTTLFYGVEQTEEGFKKYTLTRREFYCKTGMIKAREKNKVWNSVIKGVIDQLSQTCKKSNTVSAFLEYVGIVRENYDVLWDELTKKKRARSRFRVYCGRKRVYDTFFKGILGNDTKRSVVLAYGDAGFASTAKYEMAAPTTNLEKEAKKWFKVAKVDEFRTSKIHYETLKQLAPVSTKNKEGKTVSVRGLHWLGSTKISKFIDRDLNAAKNILRRFKLGESLPPVFCRGGKKLESLKSHFIKRTPSIGELSAPELTIEPSMLVVGAE